MSEWQQIADGKARASLRADWRVDEWGHKTPHFKLAVDDPNDFTFPIDLLMEAARKYMQSGEEAIPTIDETLYAPNDWESQVLIMTENLKWARDVKGS